MKKRQTVLVAIRLGFMVLALLQIGCAGFRTMPVATTDEKIGVDDNKANGIRFYEPAVFILVYSNDAGSVRTEVLTLPDTTRKMVVYPRNLLAKSKLSLKFANGMLAEGTAEDPSMNGDFDATEVPKAIVDLAEKAASAYFGSIPGAGKLGNAGDGTSQEVSRYTLEAPRLYKLVVRGEHVVLQGAHPSDKIELLAAVES